MPFILDIVSKTSIQGNDAMPHNENDIDVFGPEAYGPYGEAWRWRMAKLAIFAASTAVTLVAYWNVGQTVAAYL